MSAAVALCEPGAELVFSWPAFSMYPYLAPLSGAREVRVGLDGDERHDLDAIAAELTSATQLAIEMSGPLSPGVLKPVDDPAYVHVIMPVRTPS